MKAIDKITYKGYDAHAVNKSVFGDVHTQGYVVIPEDNPLYGKTDLFLVSEHVLSFTNIYNLLDKRFDWVIMFELDHINQWGAIMDCKQIIDQLDEMVADILRK